VLRQSALDRSTIGRIDEGDVVGVEASAEAGETGAEGEGEELVRLGVLPESLDRQLVLARLADQAIALYAQAAVLARAASVVESKGEEGAAAELLLARGACRRRARAARDAVAALRDNEDGLLLETAALVRRAAGLPGDPT